MVLVAATLVIDYVYLAPRGTLPAKFLVPGTFFLIAFQIIPIVYTIKVAFTNYATGHILAKSEAIEAVKVNSLAAPPDGQTYTMTPARAEDGTLVLLLLDDAKGKTSSARARASSRCRSDVELSGWSDLVRRRLHAGHGRRAVRARPCAHRRTVPTAAKCNSSARRASTARWSSNRRCDTTSGRAPSRGSRAGGSSATTGRARSSRRAARSSSPAGRPASA